MKRKPNLFAEKYQMYKYLQWFLLSVLAFACAPSALAQNQTDPPPFSDNSATPEFPQRVDFQITFDPAHPPKSVTLHYLVDKVTCIEAPSNTPVDIDDTGTAAWTWELVRSGNVPVGTKVTWWWSGETAAGQSFTIPPQTTTMVDGRFEWQHTSRGNINLYWYASDELQEPLLDAAEEGMANMQESMGITLQEESHLYIYDNSNDLHDSLLYVQGWAGGVAFLDYNTILMEVNQGNLDDWGLGAVRHELAHLAIAQFSRSCVGGSRPSWLEEGLASYAQGELDDNTQSLFNNAVDDDAFEPVRSLGGTFSAHSDEAGSAYAQSYSLVAYLLEEYDQEAMQTLLLALADGKTTDLALEEAYGFNIDGLEQAWRTHLGLPQRDIPPTPTPWNIAQVATVAPLTAGEAHPTPAITATPTQPDTTTSAPDSQERTGTVAVLILFGIVCAGATMLVMTTAAIVAIVWFFRKRMLLM